MSANEASTPPTPAREAPSLPRLDAQVWEAMGRLLDEMLEQAVTSVRMRRIDLEAFDKKLREMADTQSGPAQATLARLTDRRNGLEEEIAALDKHVDDFRFLVESLGKLREEVETRDRLQVESVQTIATLEKKRAELEQALAEADLIRAEAEQARARAEQAETAHEQAQAEVEEARAETEKARAEIEEARAETEKARADTEEARAEIEKARAEAQEARAELASERKQRRHLEEVVELLSTTGQPVRTRAGSQADVEAAAAALGGPEAEDGAEEDAPVPAPPASVDEEGPVPAPPAEAPGPPEPEAGAPEAEPPGRPTTAAASLSKWDAAISESGPVNAEWLMPAPGGGGPQADRGELDLPPATPEEAPLPAAYVPATPAGGELEADDGFDVDVGEEPADPPAENAPAPQARADAEAPAEDEPPPIGDDARVHADPALEQHPPADSHDVKLIGVLLYQDYTVDEIVRLSRLDRALVKDRLRRLADIELVRIDG